MKGQGALEWFMVYGWAILILLVVGIILFVVGDF